MKKNNAICVCTTAIVILLASLVGCDCVAANDWGFGPVEQEKVVDWGFGPIQPEAETVEAANILAMKTPSGRQEMVCDENGCWQVVNTTTAPVATWVGNYSATLNTCPCGCGIAGCNCGGGAMAAATIPPGYHAHRAHDGSIVVHHNSNYGNYGAHRGMSLMRIGEGGDSLSGIGGYGVFGLRSGPVFVRGGGYGLLGLRARPWGWRIRALFGR